MVSITIKQGYAEDFDSLPSIKFDEFKYEPDGLTKFYKDGVLVGKIRGREYTTIEFDIPKGYFEADLSSFKDVIEEMLEDL